MSQTTAQTRVLQAIEDGNLSPYGTARLQMQDTTGYVAVPIELVQALEMEQGSDIQRGYDAETGCLIISLREDYDLFATN